MRILLLSALILVLSVPPALAEGKVVSCGVPETIELNTTSGIPDFCDVYARQMLYPAGQEKLKEQLLERQKNYYAPRKEAHDNYQKQLESRWKRATPGND